MGMSKLDGTQDLGRISAQDYLRSCDCCKTLFSVLSSLFEIDKSGITHTEERAETCTGTGLDVGSLNLSKQNKLQTRTRT